VKKSHFKETYLGPLVTITNIMKVCIITIIFNIIVHCTVCIWWASESSETLLGEIGDTFIYSVSDLAYLARAQN